MKRGKKELIIEAAESLFIEKGYVETKVEDITKKIGISKGNFYTYFKSKDDVLYEIIEMNKIKTGERIGEIDVNRSPSEILEEFFIFKIKRFLKHIHTINLKTIGELLENEKINRAREEIKNMELEFLEENVLKKYDKQDKAIIKFIHSSVEAFIFNESCDGELEEKETYIERRREAVKKVIKFLDNGLKQQEEK